MPPLRKPEVTTRGLAIAFFQVIGFFVIVAVFTFALVWVYRDPSPESVVVLLTMVLSGIGFVTAWLKRSRHDPDSLPAQTKQEKAPEPKDDRGRLLDKVRTHWIEGVLEKSRINEIFITLEGERVTNIVHPPIERVHQHRNETPVSLESGEQIADVFKRSGRALLIVGEPGSGKTMTLLELARDLLEKAAEDTSLPVPVVLNLASWGEKCPEQLEEWLIERLFIDYRVSRKQGQRWIEDGALLFLLDGLDEVAEQHRSACAQAISVFWERYNWVNNGIVVCCRSEEYAALDEKLRLDDAIHLKQLTLVQACDYLTRLGSDWHTLRDAIPHDAILRELSASPLLLNIMAVAYGGEPVEQITGFTSQAAQEQHLFDHYIARRLNEEEAHPEHSHTEIKHHLAWLARKMIKHNPSVFHIEGLQPTWLDTPGQRRWYRWTVPIIIGLGVGLVGGLGGGLVGGLGGGLVGGLGGGLVGGLVGGLGGEDKIITKERLSWSWQNAREELVGGLGVGLVFGLVFGLGVGLVFGLGVGLGGGLGVGLGGGLGGGLVGGLGVGLGVGLVFGLGVGLVGGLDYGGYAVIQHSVLRTILWCAGVAPLNYAEFLEYTSQRHLTRQVGGGFIFRHRMLQEHFAEHRARAEE